MSLTLIERHRKTIAFLYQGAFWAYVLGGPGILVPAVLAAPYPMRYNLYFFSLYFALGLALKIDLRIPLQTGVLILGAMALFPYRAPLLAPLAFFFLACGVGLGVIRTGLQAWAHRDHLERVDQTEAG